MNEQREDGITLVALVITVIIIIILATVAISFAFGENGLINRAENAGEMYANDTAYTEGSIANVESYINDILIGSGENEDSSEKTPIDTDSKVGCYADTDGDEEPDGIIYADLAVAKSGQWTDENGEYSYEAITGTKEYYVSKIGYEESFGTNDVITAISEEGEDRFFVMALEDFNSGTEYCWYHQAGTDYINDYATITSGDFETGKTNTETMITKWKAGEYGTQNAEGTYLDMWEVIQAEVEEGWFVPSRGEWSAFADNLGITYENYEDYGLSDCYWSSSLVGIGTAAVADIPNEAINIYRAVNYVYNVRLSTTY